jgi:hypothetical protein
MSKNAPTSCYASACPLVTIQELLNEFQGNFIVGGSTKVWRHIPVSDKVGQHNIHIEGDSQVTR